MQKNVASQKFTVFAFDLTDNTPKTGDANQITANLRIDDGGASGITDTNPTELEDGYYSFDLTQGETDGDKLHITPESSTSNIQVIGVPGVVYTNPPNYQEMGIESDGDLTKVNLCDVNTDVGNLNDFDPTSDAVANVTLVATTTTNSDMRGSDIGTLNDFDPTSDAVANVTLVATTTTNTDMRGSDIGTLNDFDPANDTVARVTLVDTTTTNTDMVAEAPTVSEIDTELTSNHGIGDWISADLTTLETDIAIIKQVGIGRWKLDAVANTQTIYDSDDTTPLVTFDTTDSSGNPASENVYERVPQ